MDFVKRPSCRFELKLFFRVFLGGQYLANNAGRASVQNMNPPPSDRENDKSDYGSEGLKFESSRVRIPGTVRALLSFLRRIFSQR